MSVRKSTKFCNLAILNAIAATDADALKIFTTIQLRLYGGTVPTTADAAAATLLCTITGPAAAALTFAASAAAGVLLKSAQVWSGVVTGVGTQDATYFRFVSAADDDGATGSTYPRIQGSVGLAGVELDMSSVSQVNGATTTINYCALLMTPN